jgi:hypothetical protein
MRESIPRVSRSSETFSPDNTVMKLSSVSVLILLTALVPISIAAQSVRPDPMGRPRIVGQRTGTSSKTTFQAPATQAQTPSRRSDPGQADKKPVTSAPRQVTEKATESFESRKESSADARRLTPSRIHTRITEAERLMKSRAVPTAMTTPLLDYVTVAALLPETSQIHLIRIAKQSFLTKGAELSLTTSLGLPVQLRVVRANGVNTAVTIFDDRNRALAPLVVEFPIERFGRFREMAYYTSAHPALLSNDLTKTGQNYVNSMVEMAAKRVRDRGVPIAQNVVEVAKRLCVVEHVDHDRFRNENRIALFDEIYSLYALNELDTYRYSVSSAGAGGMVQMIPWTYALMRQRHPGVGLNPDFVAGMGNHGNALEAMLLYMQDTWNDLSANEDVQMAIAAKQATPTEIMAAGYNSNAAKIPGYIRRAGAGWRALIPRETQMYLQIYQSLDSLSRAKENHARKIQKPDR